jgi:hypothetical protein
MSHASPWNLKVPGFVAARIGPPPLNPKPAILVRNDTTRGDRCVGLSQFTIGAGDASVKRI